MEVIEEVVRRRQTLAVDDPGRAYPEIRDLLERRMSFDAVSEERYYNDVDEGIIRARIICTEHFDNHTHEELELYLFISKPSNELEIQLKGKLETHYEMEGWKDTLWYYAYRALYDKFLYGEVRHGYHHAVEEKAEELMERIRQNLEAVQDVS